MTRPSRNDGVTGSRHAGGPPWLPAWRGAAPVLTAAARTVLCAAAGLMLWTQAPTLAGWFPMLVASGSMSPHVRTGDVLVYQPGGSPHRGQVILFHDPADPARLLTHRVVRVLPRGALVTQGDANPTPDDTPVPRRLYIALARLRVPLVGLPALWWRQNAYPALVAVLGSGLVLVHLAFPRLLPRTRPGSP